MAENGNVLSYKRETLINTLNERLAERVQKREEAQAKLDEKNRKAADAVKAAIDAHPQFLVWIAAALRSKFGFGYSPTEDDFATLIARHYDPAPAADPVEDPYDPDEDIKRMIRVYEKADDEIVKVDVTDPVYRYL